jgi:hypothetical protein
MIQPQSIGEKLRSTNFRVPREKKKKAQLAKKME